MIFVPIAQKVQKFGLNITKEILEIVDVPNCIKHIGIPNRFINNYGTYTENCESLQIDVMGIRNKILSFINI